MGAATPLVLAVPSDAENFSRSADLEFVSLQGGNTAALTFNHVPLQRNGFSLKMPGLLAENRPAFLGISLVWLLA